MLQGWHENAIITFPCSPQPATQTISQYPQPRGRSGFGTGKHTRIKPRTADRSEKPDAGVAKWYLLLATSQLASIVVNRENGPANQNNAKRARPLTPCQSTLNGPTFLLACQGYTTALYRHFRHVIAVLGSVSFVCNVCTLPFRVIGTIDGKR